MHPSPSPGTEERLQRLEAAVDDLRRAVLRIEAALPAAAGPAPEPAAAAAPVTEHVYEPWRPKVAEGVAGPVPVAVAVDGEEPPPAQAWMAAVEPMLNGEFWLSKVGVGLLLLGVAFLFKYSIDQGWVTPVVRLASGAATAAALTTAGLRLGSTQRQLSRVLLGGGIGIFYIVGFAAAQLYGLLPPAAAMAYMGAVTAVAYWLSLREDEPVLTVVGTLAGAGAPFLLYPRTGSLAWLAAYVGSIALWNGVVYARRRWDVALGPAALGSWVALVSGLVVTERAGPVAAVDRWALQGATVLVWAVLGVLPAALLVLRPVEEDDAGDAADDRAERVVPAVLAFVSPLVALLLTRATWPLDDTAWGAGTAVAGAAYLGGAHAARRARPELAAVLAVTAALLGGIGTLAAAGGELRVVLLAAQAAALHQLARRGFGRGAAAYAHLVFGGLALAGVAALGVGNPLAAVVGPEGLGAPQPVSATTALTGAAVVAAAFAAGWGARDPGAVWYRGAAHLGVLLWGWRLLAPLPRGEELAVAAWAAYGLGLLALRGRAAGPERAFAAHVAFGTLGALAVRHLADADPLSILALPRAGGEGWGLDARAAADLLAAGAAFAAARFVPERARPTYLLAVHGAVLAWSWRVFSGLPAGEGIVSAVWGVYAVTLLVVATLRGRPFLQTVAKATLIVLLAKMFLVDLRALEALWRVLLFSGLGGLFLLLSWFVGKRRLVLPGGR